MASLLEKQDDHRPDEITSWHQLTSKYPEIPEKYHPQDPAYLQAEDISRDVESELGSRVDLRDLPTATIDPDYAHDHDDAVSMIEDEDGYTAFVHIADVAHYVEEGSPIDEKAKDRGVTFYLGDNTRHMLPRRLAQDICSLSPGADRLAHTVEMDVTEDGEVEDFDIYRSVIESDAHLTYTHSDRILENADSISEWYHENDIQHEDAQDFRGLAESLDSLDTVTENMREDRWDESLILNNRQSPSSRIIEEMMITANETVGEYLSDEGIGGYRVEEAPERGWTEEVASELSQLGYEPPAELHDNPARSLNNFFAEIVDEEDEKQARKAVVTKLPRARYEARGITPAGHFGLGTQDYAHFTSPSRRAVDLVNHRIVADTFEGGREELSELAENTSDQQEAADEAAMAWYDANT